MTKGQKNKLIAKDWLKRKIDIQTKTGCKIFQPTKAGVNSVWNFFDEQGVESSYGFNSPEEVVEFLETKEMMKNLKSTPGTCKPGK